MKILSVKFSKFIYWRIRKDDALSYELKSIAGWSILNPLVYFEIAPSSEFFPIQTRLIGMADDKTVLAQIDGLMFVAPPLANPDNFNSEQFAEYLNTFIEHLRHASKQADIARDVLAMSFDIELPELPTITFPVASKEQTTAIRYYIAITSITWENIKAADTTLVNKSLPVFYTLLLDAILAYMEHDYRRAILYAAISAETVANIRLDEAYDKILHEGDPQQTIRLITIPQKKESIVKDPIYEYLSNKTDFKQLIHERPLYLFRRSLLIENEQLYQAANKLYRTRNKIVHRGELSPGEETSHLEINDGGAKEAIECVINLFKWFEVSETYVVPSTQFVRCFSIAIPQ
jgi:hypothetical protein